MTKFILDYFNASKLWKKILCCIFENEKMRMKQIIYLFLILFISGCGPEKRPIQGETEYQRKVNADFKDASKSPLKKKDRENFTGLDFFKFDESYIISAQLERTPNTEFFEMPTTTGEISRERVYGILKFELKGKVYQLEVYQGEELMATEGFEDYLFLPFIDDTNGETTYGGGRYIELRVPDGDIIEIDFNKAYNPYCAYNEKFSCPIVPRVNYLPLKIEAGIKAFKKS